MNLDNDLKFEPSTFGIDSSSLDNITDDDIKVIDTPNLPKDDKVDLGIGNLDLDKDQDKVDPEKDNKDEGAEDGDEDPGDDNENDDLEKDIDSLTTAEVVVELLNQEGLQIYNEIPKGLTMEQFVKDIPEYISSIEQEIRRDEAAKLGKFQEYYEMMVNQEIEPEALKPALVLESTASMDLNDRSITTEDLINVIKTKHLVRGLSDEEATALANLNSKDLNKLKDEALNAQDFISQTIENIKKDVVLEKEMDQKTREQDLLQEQNSFVEALNSLNLTKNQKQEFFDIRYKRDQQITYTDENGIQRRDLVTKFDVLSHQLYSNPKKLVAFIDFLANDQDAPNLKKSVASSYSKKLLERLEGSKEKKSDNNNFRQKPQVSTNTQNKIEFQSRTF